MVNDNSVITQSLIFAIRQYVSSQNVSSQKNVNRILHVENAMTKFRMLNSEIEVSDDVLRDLLCREAIRFGMVLRFGKEI